MSDSNDNVDDTNTSIFSNLKNKFLYTVQKAVYDPKANAYAKKIEEDKIQKEEKQKEKEEEKKKAETTDNSKFSSVRLIKKIGNQTLYYLRLILVPFVALMLAMIVANEFIVYSAPIRIIFFIFTLLLCIFLPFIEIILGMFYLLKGAYSYYVNNMTSSEQTQRRHIMPTIFALLPITTTQPTTTLGQILLYPFSYPKTEISAQKIPELMKEYWNDLVNSFQDYEKYTKADTIKKLETNLLNLHEKNNHNQSKFKKYVIEK